MVESSNIGVNAISLVAAEDSTITSVSLYYSGRAEITRNFKFEVKKGHNKVIIAGLPHVLQHNSVRIEGRGNASIHDVVVSKSTPPRNPTNEPSKPNTPTSPRLNRARDEIEKGITSAQEVRNALRTYLSTINATHFGKSRLEETLQTYSTLARRSDLEILSLNEELAGVNEKIEQEQKKKALESPQVHMEVPSWQVSINIHSQSDENLSLDLKYVVYSANWFAKYEFRIDSKAASKPVTVLYKAVVTQNTGESWDNVPLTLETATPTFGIEIPNLSSWRLKPIQPTENHDRERRERSRSYSRERTRNYSYSRHRQPSRDHGPRRDRVLRDSLSPRRRRRSRSPSPDLMHRPAEILHKSDVVATFCVPGLVSVPSGGASHNYTVAELSLEAELFWYAVPSVETRAHIKGKIKNDTEYSFIPGSASIYMDGSFIATTNIPAISPQETFECPLGFDPSIRFTYHSRERKSVQSGFYTKAITQTFTQRITINVAKSCNLSYLKVVDRVPVSEDERIEVKVLLPSSLSVNSSSSTTTVSGTTVTIAPAPALVGNALLDRASDNAVVQWEGANDTGVDQSSIGKNGKFHWLVAVPPQGTISLVLQFEVNYPEGLNIEGL